MFWEKKTCIEGWIEQKRNENASQRFKYNSFFFGLRFDYSEWIRRCKIETHANDSKQWKRIKITTDGSSLTAWKCSTRLKSKHTVFGLRALLLVWYGMVWLFFKEKTHFGLIWKKNTNQCIIIWHTHTYTQRSRQFVRRPRHKQTYTSS